MTSETLEPELLIAFVEGELINRLRGIMFSATDLSLSTNIIALLKSIEVEAADGICHWKSLLDNPEWWREYYKSEGILE